MISRLPGMAHSPGEPGSPHRRRLRWGWPGAVAGAGAIAVTVAIAVGVSQATTAPACAAVLVPAAAPAYISAAAQLRTPQLSAARQVRGGQVSGEATHYVLAPGTGNCSYPGLPAGQLYVALSPAEYGSAAACGSYVTVTGPHGSVTAEVVDQCPPCQAGHVNLGEPAFARIAPLAAGLVPVTYHTMVDPPLSGPLSFLVKTGSSAYWLALLVIGAGNAVTSVRVGSAMHPAQQLARASYNYWLAPAGMGAGPFTVQVTDSAGHQVTVSGIGLTPGVVQATGTWMYGASAPTGAPAAAMSAAPAGPSASATAHRTGTPSVRGSTSPAPGYQTAARRRSADPATASPSASC